MYCTACRAKEQLSCGFLAFPAAVADCSCCCRLQLLLQISAAAAVGICKQNTEITEITQGRQGPALYVQYDCYLGVASE
jgi:hypothetical protein